MRKSVLSAILALCASIAAAPVGAARADAAASVPAAGVPARARPLVVLDPGHGGSNTGAAGVAPGTHEKQLTLAMARKVRARLEARGIDVVLTRDGDRTMTLRQRTAVADRLAADLFVSLHANASPTRNRRGFETYVLTPAGVDVDARALRAEVATPRAGVDGATAAVLDDVERGAAEWEAADLAESIQAHLRRVRGQGGDRGVKQNAHDVMLGATMPAVLVEIGFIDHPVEGRELFDPATQDAIAGALADAIAGRLADR
jgi:N-acetylmuramoyl-L-alanine amidase